MNLIESPQGYLAWRYGTADNVEIFDIEVFEKQKKYGTLLVKILLESLKMNPPVMIFGFTRQSNVIAQQFYSALGFNVLSGIEDHCLFWQIYSILNKKIRLRM